MREEYDLSKLRLKRRGPLPGLEKPAGRPAKVRITIALDQDLVDHFKSRAAEPGALPYQTQINQALRRAIRLEEATAVVPAQVKSALLEDPAFIEQVAERVTVFSAD